MLQSGQVRSVQAERRLLQNIQRFRRSTLRTDTEAFAGHDRVQHVGHSGFYLRWRSTNVYVAACLDRAYMARTSA
jgi:hypothetical protein